MWLEEMKNGGKENPKRGWSTCQMLLRGQKELKSEKNNIDFSGRVKKMQFVRRQRPKCVCQHRGKSW